MINIGLLLVRARSPDLTLAQYWSIYLPLGSVSAHIKILINKIQELELSLNWKLTLSTRSQSSTKLLNIFIYVFLSGPSSSFWIETIKLLMEKRKSFQTKSAQRGESWQVRISEHFFKLSVLDVSCLVLVQLLLYSVVHSISRSFLRSS